MLIQGYSPPISRLKGRLQPASDPYLIFHNKRQDAGRIIANDSQSRLAPESTKKEQLQETVLDACCKIACMISAGNMKHEKEGEREKDAIGSIDNNTRQAPFSQDLGKSGGGRRGVGNVNLEARASSFTKLSPYSTQPNLYEASCHDNIYH